MNDIYILEAITIDPPITEQELAPKIAAGEYQTVTWEDDGHMGDGHFVKTASDHGDGLIGIGFTEIVEGEGPAVHVGRYLTVDPTRADHHRDVEGAIAKIVADFGTTPDGEPRAFPGALYIEDDEQDEKILVRHGQTVRVTITTTS
jgi:hypothetical protein